MNQHIIPNGEIGIASNYTKEKSRVNLDVEVAYKEDLDRVMEIIDRVGAEMSDDPEFGPKITDPLKSIRVQEFGASGIAIKVMGETVPMEQWTVAGEFRRRIKRVFDDEGIEIPFPHMTVYWGPGENPAYPAPVAQKPPAAQQAAPQPGNSTSRKSGGPDDGDGVGE